VKDRSRSNVSEGRVSFDPKKATTMVAVGTQMTDRIPDLTERSKSQTNVTQKSALSSKTREILLSSQNEGFSRKTSTSKSPLSKSTSRVVVLDGNLTPSPEKGGLNNCAKSLRSDLSLGQSLVSLKSFHGIKGLQMSRLDAAILLQTAWRGYKAREEYQFMHDRQNKKVPILKTLKRGRDESVKQIDCYALTKQGFVDRLCFNIKSQEEGRRRTSNEFFIDLSRFVKIKVLGLA